MRTLTILSVVVAVALAFDAMFMNGQLLDAFLDTAAYEGYKFRSAVARIAEKLFL